MVLKLKVTQGIFVRLFWNCSKILGLVFPLAIASRLIFIMKAMRTLHALQLKIQYLTFACRQPYTPLFPGSLLYNPTCIIVDNVCTWSELNHEN